jgi:hypothetical protein
MGTISINEPQRSREVMLMPGSVNEPAVFDLPDAEPPVVSALEPTEAAIGDPSFRLYVTGEQFHVGSVIVFAGYDEPTTLEDDGRLSTGVNMDVWFGPDTVSVGVLNGDKLSNLVDFTFLPSTETEVERFGQAHTPEELERPPGLHTADPDDLEEEIEEAEDEGEFTAMHVSKTTVVKKSKKTKR